MITGTAYILFGLFEDGHKQLLAVSADKQELTSFALTERAMCGGIFVALTLESFGGIEYIEKAQEQSVAEVEKSAETATNELLARVMKAAKT